MTEDYYQVLQVERQATADEISCAYRHRARELHPNASSLDCKPFIELQEAFTVLADPARRAVYDRGAAGIPLRPARRAPAPPRPGPFHEVDPAIGCSELSLTDAFAYFHPSFDELFARLWSNFDRITRPKAERLESLTVDVPLSPMEAASGGKVRVLVPARVTCPRCRGRGAIGYYECWHCRGEGALVVQYPVTLEYPAALLGDYVVRLALDRMGIHNFYLTVRFRPTEIV